jgi:hypothetical protein
MREKGAERRLQNVFETGRKHKVGHQLLVATEASIWIVSFALVVLGVVKAAYSGHPLFWLAIWPAPIVLISTIAVFLRLRFHYRNGVLVLGRRQSHNNDSSSRKSTFE